MSRRPGTTDPHRSRERALKVLFQADLRRASPVDMLARVVADADAAALLDDVDLDQDELTLEDRVAEARVRGTSDLDLYARSLVTGVGDHLAELDALIDEYATNWTVDRMPTVDRNVLRLALYELLHEDTPPAVVIDEALQLARDLSTDKSAKFVNGVLEAVRRQREATPT